MAKNTSTWDWSNFDYIDDSGDLSLNNAANSLLSVIPGGSVFAPLLSGLLGDFDLDANFKLVQEYGLSSWGASSSPDIAKKKFAQQAIPIIEKLLGEMTPQNMESSLNELEKYLTFLIELESHKLREHSKADSTKAGRQVIIDFATDWREKSVRTPIQSLINNGSKITFLEKAEYNKDITYKWSSTDNSLHDDQPYKYRVYSIKSLKASTTSAKGSVSDDEPKEESSVAKNIGIAIVAGLLLKSF